ncbi:ryncolin-4-like [Branchiostoma floridae x Branchiostoma belcheri]
MSAGNDAEQLREQQKKYQQKTDGRFKAMEAQLAKQKAALAKMQKDFESAAKPAGKEETTVIGSDVHGALDASMSLDKILRGKMSKRLTRATPDAKATPMPQHATTPVPAIPAYFMAEIHYDPKDCSDWYMAGSVEDGPQHIQPRGSPTKHQVYCKMDQDSGWTVIHARKSPKLDFYQRSWDDFKKGFKQGGWESFWLGNDLIHNITRQATYELKVIGNMDGIYPTLAAHYSTFKVGSEADRYRLELGEFLGGEHGDVLRENDGGQFVTVDRNDESTFGWWEYSQTGDPSLQIPFMRMKDLTMMIKPTKDQP